MSAFNITNENRPPRETVIWGRYRLTNDHWSLMLTCRRGCCANDGQGALVLPIYWKEATPEEAEQFRRMTVQASER